LFKYSWIISEILKTIYQIKDDNDSEWKCVYKARIISHYLKYFFDPSFALHDIRSLTETLHLLPYVMCSNVSFTFIYLRPINLPQTYETLIEKFLTYKVWNIVFILLWIKYFSNQFYSLQSNIFDVFKDFKLTIDLLKLVL